MLRQFQWIVLFFFVTTPLVHAVQSVNVQTYNPSTSSKFVLLEDGLRTEWPNLAKYYAGGSYNYVQDPLVATDLKRQGQVSSIINSIQTVDLFLGYKPDKQLGLYFGMPIHTVTYEPGNPLAVANPGMATGTTSAAGDAKLMAKIRLNQEDGNTDWALIPEVHLPTGNTEHFVSDASTYLAMRLSVERVFEKFTLAINGGFGVAQNAIYETIDMRKRVIFGIGGFMPFTDQWGGNVEFNAQIPVPFSNYLNPNEFYAGLRFAPTEAFAITGGGSIGKMSGSTGQNFRAIVGLRYAFLEDAPAQPVSRPVYYAPPNPAPVAAASPTPWPSATPAVTPKPSAAAMKPAIPAASPFKTIQAPTVTDSSKPVAKTVKKVANKKTTKNLKAKKKR